MPNKDTERKRQWEREHREQRNAKRRMQSRAMRSGEPTASNAASDRTREIVARLKKQSLDPVAKNQQPSGWKVLLGVAVGLGVLVLAAMAGIDVPPPNTIGGQPGSGASF